MNKHFSIHSFLLSFLMLSSVLTFGLMPQGVQAEDDWVEAEPLAEAPQTYPTQGEVTVSDDYAGEAKEGFSSGVRGIGKGFSSGAKATGRGFVKVGKSMGHGFKKVGRGFSYFFTGKWIKKKPHHEVKERDLSQPKAWESDLDLGEDPEQTSRLEPIDLDAVGNQRSFGDKENRNVGSRVGSGKIRVKGASQEGLTS